MGGVHGNNRLGGNSLLDCVVYGRVAGKACAKYLLGSNMKNVSLKDLSGGGISGGGTNKSALSGGSYEDEGKGGSPGAKAAAAAAPAAPAAAKPAPKAAAKGGELGCIPVMICVPI